ncbi:unnamed protein product, partial [Urochloa humidicola]
STPELLLPDPSSFPFRFAHSSSGELPSGAPSSAAILPPPVCTTCDTTTVLAASPVFTVGASGRSETRGKHDRVFLAELKDVLAHNLAKDFTHPPVSSPFFPKGSMRMVQKGTEGTPSAPSISRPGGGFTPATN